MVDENLTPNKISSALLAKNPLFLAPSTINSYEAIAITIKSQKRTLEQITKKATNDPSMTKKFATYLNDYIEGPFSINWFNYAQDLFSLNSGILNLRLINQKTFDKTIKLLTAILAKIKKQLPIRRLADLTLLKFDIIAIRGTWHIKLLIPLIDNNEKITIYSLTKSKFLIYKSKKLMQLSLNYNPALLAINKRNTTYTIPHTHLTRNCIKIRDNFFCSNFENFQNTNSCLASIYKENWKSTVQMCKWHAEILNKSLLRLDDTNFILGSDEDSQLSLNCNLQSPTPHFIFTME